MDTSPFARFDPAPALAPYIECYWMLSPGQIPDTQRMPADGRIEIMFNFGAGSRRFAADGSDICDVEAHGFVLGARGQGYTFEHFGAPRYVAIRFKPGGLSAFIGLPIADLTDVYVDLESIWDRQSVQQLAQQLEAASSPQHQAHLLDAALLKRLNPPDHLTRVLYAIQQIDTAQAEITMPTLADEINFSQKHFERLFARYVGFRPSLYARIVRFQQAMYTVITQPKVITLGQLALIAGYYDQAHFSKDFKRFSGSTPQEFFAAQHEFIQITTPAQTVEFLQD